MFNKSKKFVVVGGGTAGWFTALFLQKTFPETSITLIESKELGILGVGEATTPHVPKFLESLGIDIFDMLSKTNGTIKNGIMFENWNGDGTKYLHGFSDRVVDWRIPGVFDSDCESYYFKLLINKNLPFKDYVYQHKLAYENKIDINHTTWAVHFDATALANYLEEIGKRRGINVIDAKVLHINSDNCGNIKSLHLDNESVVECDFLFDCSGFHRKIIGKHFNTPWVSYKTWLPMKKGIPFWLPSEPDTKSYTQAIAMKYGWMWKIPLQHRIGSGYIFDSDYINEDQALSEAEAYYGQKLEIRKVIPFDAGRFENTWVKNCISIGLSSSFLEPLESTSLWVTVIQLTTIRHFINSIETLDEAGIKTYNKYSAELVDEAMTFIYFHYMTKRNDSEFWKNFRKDYPLPPKLEEIRDIIKSADIRFFDTFEKTFPLSSFLQVGHGLEIFEQKNSVAGYESVVPGPTEYKHIIDRLSEDMAQSHNIFLKNP
jgi:tryptophan halogenase